MAQVKINKVNGTSVIVEHQYGTVRGALAKAKTLSPHEKTGDITPFAEFRTTDGRRVGINPDHVVDYDELKGTE
jgi:hypothetical protein